MRRPLFLLVVVSALLIGSLPSALAGPAAPPVPEINFAGPINAGPCTPQPGNPYELKQYKLEGWAAPNYERYPGACHRLKFVFGPIHIRPGQNDVLIEPVTIQKPAYDGYIVRMRPDLVSADGTIPPIEKVHLHHGTWIALSGDYGSGPFFASGEEKTYAPLPKGYGFPIERTDTWGLLYMIHNQLADPDEVFITYDIDYIAKDLADAPDINVHPVYPVLARRAALRLPGVQRPARLRDQGQVHLAQAELRAVRPLRQGLPEPGREVGPARRGLDVARRG